MGRGGTSCGVTGHLGSVLAVICYNQQAFVAVDKVRLLLVKEAIVFTVRLSAVIYASTGGLLGITIAVTVVSGLELVTTMLALRFGTGITFADTLFACWRSAIVGAITLGICHGAGPWV